MCSREGSEKHGWRGGELGSKLHSLLSREKLYNAEGSDLRAKRQKRVRLETSHSSSFRFVPAISWQLDKTVTFTPTPPRMRSLHVHVATQRWRVQSILLPFSCKGSPHNACISTSVESDSNRGKITMRSLYWGEPERAPPSRDIYIYIWWYVRHSVNVPRLDLCE